MALHKNLTGTSLHENKGVSTANNYEVATALSGATDWRLLDHNSLTTTGNPFGGQLFHAYEARAINVNGGTLTQNTWSPRLFTTTGKSQIASVSRTNGNITLPIGTYVCQAWAVGYSCGFHQLRLATTTGTVLVTGPAVGHLTTTENVQTQASLFGSFVLATSKIVQLQHNCQATKTSTGMGKAAGLGPEHYSDIMIWKVA